MENSNLRRSLARYGNEPAVFFQNAPDDNDEYWGESQYPRIVLIMDMFSYAETDVMGGLSIDIACSETGTMPEALEPYVRNALAGVFFTPRDGETFSAKWRETQVFKERGSKSETFILGMSVRFDVYEFPLMETSDPDPVAAIHRFATEWDDSLAVIGVAELPDIFVPTREMPAAYFRRTAVNIDMQTNTVVWLKAELAVHFFAPALSDRREWLEQFAQNLGLDGEVTMLDGSPMFIQNIVGNAKNDEMTGQLKINVRYGLLRKPKYAHTMMRAILKG